jgi:hypothetical protein
VDKNRGIGGFLYNWVRCGDLEAEAGHGRKERVFTRTLMLGQDDGKEIRDRG